MYVLLSKYLSGEYDHCGVVVRDRSCGVSYLLEVGCTGRLQLTACDTRLLHSHSREIILRKLDSRRTEQQLDSVDQLLSQLSHTQHAAPPVGQQQPFSAFSQPLRGSLPSLLLPVERLLRLSVGCVVLGAGGGEASRAVHQLGQYVQARQERKRTVARLAALTDGLASDTARQAGKQQRLLGALQRLEKRESELKRQLEKSQKKLAGVRKESCDSGAAALSDVAASLCPSAAVAALLLQRLAVLPADSWPPGSECPLPPPTASQYQPKHFLSSVSLPLAADAVLERELFIKSAGKPLPYTVTH